MESLNALTEFVEFTEFVLNTINAYRALQRNKKRFWVRELFADRDTCGFFTTTFRKLKTNDPEQFRVATRMRPEVFDCLYELLKDKLKKMSARAISPHCRIFLTLVYLAHGTSRQYLSLTFKLSVETVRRIVLETSILIWDELGPIYLSLPNQNEWERIAVDFKDIWDLPNCVGAIDGKHVAVTCPPHSGSTFYNYKGTYSIVLLAICDANYTFTAVDIGAYGSQSDGGVLTYSQIGSRLQARNLNLPPPTELPNSEVKFPHYIVGDAAFPLRPYLMRPYPGILLSDEKANFNKRLSRARRTIQNAFGILTARWRILRGTLNMRPETAEKVVGAAVVLHNFLKMNDGTYCPPEYVDSEENGVVKQGLWRKETKSLKNITRFSSNNSSRSAFQLRDILNEYLFLNKNY